MSMITTLGASAGNSDRATSPEGTLLRKRNPPARSTTRSSISRMPASSSTMATLMDMGCFGGGFAWGASHGAGQVDADDGSAIRGLDVKTSADLGHAGVHIAKAVAIGGG